MFCPNFPARPYMCEVKTTLLLTTQSMWSATEKLLSWMRVLQCAICFWSASMLGRIMFWISTNIDLILASSLRNFSCISIRNLIFLKWVELELGSSCNCWALTLRSSSILDNLKHHIAYQKVLIHLYMKFPWNPKWYRVLLDRLQFAKKCALTLYSQISSLPSTVTCPIHLNLHWTILFQTSK